MRRADAVVVGAGAMGSAAAWWLARRGRAVVVLERFERGHVRGSSHGSSRIFRLAYPVADYVAMAQAALPLWRELEDDAGRPLLTVTGGVDHGPAAVVTPVAAALEARRARHEWLTLQAAQQRWPGMRFGDVVLHQPDAGRVHADATVAALQERAAAHGADVRFNEAVDLLTVHDDGVVVQTAADEYRAPVAVVACGAWNGGLLEGLAPLPPLTVTREQVFHFDAVDTTGAWPAFIHHRRPVVYGLDALEDGVKVAEHHTGAVVDPDRRSFDVDEAGRDRLHAYVEEWLPGLEPRPLRPTTCLYTTTPTEEFVLERHGPLVVGAGFSGHGFKFTPLVGRILADLADGYPADGLGERSRG